MNSRKKKAIWLISILLFIYLFKEFLSLLYTAFPGMDQAPHGKEAVWLSEPLNRIQKTYFFENQKFATSEELNKTGFHSSSEFGDYKQLIEVIENAAFSQIIVNHARNDLYIRENLPLLSMIFGLGNTPTYTVASAAFYRPVEKDFKDIVCISNTPGWQQLNKPFLKDGEPVCGEGTTEYR